MISCAPDGSAPPADLGPPTRAAIGGPSVTTDAMSYAPGATITVTYSGLPGNSQDWIAIAPAGAANTSYVKYALTGGLTSGTATFTVSTTGTYVARAFPNNTYALLAESASFTISGPAVGTDKTSYVTGETITVSYAGLPGNADDWIALAPAGAANTSYVKYVLTGGLTSGTATFTVSSTGSYVARAFPHNTYNLLAQSPTFTVAAGTSVSTDKTSYAAGETITVTYSGLPGNASDWIALATASSANTSYVKYVQTGGLTSGTATFTVPSTGSYVARAFPNNTYNLLGQSPTFTVVAGATVSTDKTSYAAGETITVTYSGLPGNPNDWIAIAPSPSVNEHYVKYVLTGGLTSGTATFTLASAGSYVARAFPNNTYNLLGQSPTFTVTSVAATISTNKASYASGETITVTYSGLPGNADDWIALATDGTANSSYVKFVQTGGLTSGTATFTLPSPGTYVVRAFPHNTYNLLVQSSTFTVASGTTISTDKGSYAPGETITVTYSGLPGNADDWIALATDGTANTSYASYVLTGGNTSGTVTFTLANAGTYVARAFPHNTYALLAQSQTFFVTGGATTGVPRLLFPPSTATLTTKRPTMRWQLPADADGAHVRICRDRACSNEVASFDATGSSGTPATDLPSGVLFWRAAWRRAGVTGAVVTPTWSFRVPNRAASVNSASGTMSDFNGDGYEDILWSYLGALRVYAGSSSGLGTLPATTIAGTGGDAYPAGDVNGDGYADVLVAVMAKGAQGHADLYLGGAAGLSATPASTVDNPDVLTDGFFGSNASAAGDVNGDGYGDVLVGTFLFGKAFVYLGGPDGLSAARVTILVGPYDPPHEYFPGQPLVKNGNFGRHVAGAGDLNGDGCGDLAVGGDSFSDGIGRVFVYLGGTSGLSTTPTLTLQDSANRSLLALTGGGDLDGDGKTDLALRLGNPDTVTVVAAIHKGGASGFSYVSPPIQSTLPDWIAFADFDGDGYSDVAMTRPLYAGNALLVQRGSAGGLLAAVPVTSGNAPYGRPIAADWTGDGFMDLALINHDFDASARIVLHRGSASGLQAPIDPEIRLPPSP